MDFTVIQGDIAAQAADALVNAAGTSLRMGSGVAGALRRAANGPINEAAMEQGPVDLGDAVVTDAFDLDASMVIHAAAMPHYGSGEATTDSISTATRNALVVADARGCHSVVLPVLGTGAAGFRLEEGATVVCNTVWDYEPSSLADVRIIAYSTEEYTTVKRVASTVRSTT